MNQSPILPDRSAFLLYCTELHYWTSLLTGLNQSCWLCRETDVGMVLALLAAVADGDMFERADAVHALLRWRSGQRGGIPQSSIALYIAGLKVTHPPTVDEASVRAKRFLYTSLVLYVALSTSQKKDRAVHRWHWSAQHWAAT